MQKNIFDFEDTGTEQWQIGMANSQLYVCKMLCVIRFLPCIRTVVRRQPEGVRTQITISYRIRKRQ